MYCITVDPGAIPVTIPLNDPTIAIEGTDELHVPPVGAEVSVAGVDVQTTAGPAMAAGIGLTVKTAVALHPVVGAVA